jgi:hypothetical protein
VAGTLAFDHQGFPVAVTFVATTPLDGKAMVSIVGTAPQSLQVADPCPS